MELASIPEILEDVRDGRMVILVDDPRRENEGDICIAAECVTPEIINFMRKECGGLICLALTQEKCDALGLGPQVSENQTPHGTGFTVSIEAREGVTTGISAQDRAHTVRVAVRKDARPQDLVRPGHIFPLRAREGGVLVRSGHTEAIVDLCQLAGRDPSGVICEIMSEDGSMARVPELLAFAEKHGVKIGTIADLIEYRRRRERMIERLPVLPIPTPFGDFDLHPYRSKVDGVVHLAFTHGIPRSEGPDDPYPRIEDPVHVRVHASNILADVFGSQSFLGGPPVQLTMRRIADAERGVFLYMRHGGRGVRVDPELLTEYLQGQGHQDPELAKSFGFWMDRLEYGTGAQILHDLGVRQMKLLTNNPRRLSSLAGYGLEVVEEIPIIPDPEELDDEPSRFQEPGREAD